jgi:hypothetical protein
MVWLSSNRRRFMFVGIVATMVLGGGSAKADFTFGTPKNIGPPLSSNRGEWGPCISADGLEFYVSSNRDGSVGGYDLWVSTRATIDDEWGEPENLGELINSPEEDGNPTLSADGLELYFNSPRSDSLGGQDIYVTTRATRSDPWGPAVNLGPPVNTPGHDSAPSISGDGLELYFNFSDPNLPDDDPAQGFCVTRRETKDAPWGEPVNLGPVINSWPCMWEPEISGDGLLLMWNDYWNCEPRPDGFGETDIWYSRRATKDSEWSEPVNLGPAINTPFDEGGPEISVDGSMLIFASNHCGSMGNYDFWQAPILPVVDFDDDGSVGISDLLMLVEAWETDDPKCDIGPMPWGDGVVDAADLDVLMDHWNQEASIAPVELVAHWAFDETEGMKAYDSAGVCDANLMGDPIWQPEGGMVGGAIELDGIGDYVSAPFVLPRPDTAFSAFAWVKGGERNHVIISESGAYGYFLLQADFIAGNLMTSFMAGFGNHLFSETPIIDGQWHHVGIVWNGYPSNRILYVDGIEVARDTVLECWGTGGSIGGRGIYIGASWGLDTHRDYYWNGLIDDVRIYEGTLSPEKIAALAQ